MEPKKYSSYAEIDRDLQIIRTERDIHYKKIVFGIDKTKESFVPPKAVTIVGNIVQKATSGMLGTVLKIAVPFAVNWYINRKRGN